MINNQNRAGARLQPQNLQASPITRRGLLGAPVFANEDDSRNSYLLNFITLAYFAAGLFVIVLALAAATPDNFQQSLNQSLVQGVPLIAILVVAQVLLRSGRVKIAAISFGVLLWLNQTYSLYITGGAASYSLFNYILTVMTFGLLLGRGYAIANAIASTVVAVIFFILGNQGLLPTSSITGDPAAIGLFTFIFTALLTTALLYLYLEQLDSALRKFRDTNMVLEDAKNTLEQRVVERTQSLALAAEVGRSVSQVRNLSVMLKEAVDLIRESFDLYYVQVYLVNRAQTHLELEAGTGDVGQQLLARQHRLPLDPASINGRAAVEQRPVVIPDTLSSPVFRPNELLPHTRSEMAVPLVVNAQVVGVLDMQSARTNALTSDSLSAFETLAGQLAIAIQNANLLAEAEQVRAEVEKQAARATRSNWLAYLNAIHQPEHIGFVFDQHEVQPLSETERPSLTEQALVAPISITGEAVGALTVELSDAEANPQAAELIKTVARQVAEHLENLRLLENAERFRFEAELASNRLTREGWQGYIGAQGSENLDFIYDLTQVKPASQASNTLLEEAPTVKLPLMVRETKLGELTVLGLDANDQPALEIAQSVMERLGAHIENLRLSEQIGKRAADLATVAEVSVEVSQITETSKLLQQVVDQTKATFNLYHAHIYLLNAEGDTLNLMAGAGEVGRQMVAEGRFIPLDREQSLVARAARQRQGVIVNDVRAEPGFLPHPLLPETRSELAVPMIVGDQVIGVFDVQADTVGRFTEEDASIQTALAAQVAVALQNTRLIDQAQKRASELETLNQLGQTLNAAPDLNQTLKAVGETVINIFRASSGFIALYDEQLDQVEWPYFMDANRQVSVPPTTVSTGPTAHIIRTRQPLIVNENIDERMKALGARQATNQGAVERSWVGLPILSGERVIGVLSVGSAEENRFDSDDVRLLTTIANSVATSIERARLFVQAQKSATDLAAVAELGALVATQRDPQLLLSTAVELTKERFQLYHAQIYLLNELGDTLVLAAGAGEAGQQMLAQGWSVPLNREHSLVARVARTRLGEVVNDITAEPDFLPNLFLPETHSELAVPLLAGGELLGVLDMQSERVGRFSQADVDIQTAFAVDLGTTLQNARLSERSEKALAELDMLNRRMTREGWDEYLNQAAEQAKAYQYDLTQVRTLHTGTLTPALEAAQWQLKVQDEVIGKLEVAEAELPAEETEELVAAVAERLSVHLETLRLTEETQVALARNRILYEQEQIAKRESETRAQREQILREITARLAAAADVASVLQVAAQEVGRALNRPTYVVIDPAGSAPQPN